MGFIDFVLAISPIAFVLVGILAFKKPAMKVAPLALVWTMLLAFTYFNITDLTFQENVVVLDALLWKGIKEGLKIVAMVFGAFVILNTLKRTGAIEDVKNTVARVSGQDRRVQLIVVGMMVPIFLEGAAGAGAPAAIAAPFLVALGFDPITAIAVALLGDATPCSWGGARPDHHQRRRGPGGGRDLHQCPELRHGGPHPYVRRADHPLPDGGAGLWPQGLQGHRSLSVLCRRHHRRRHVPHQQLCGSGDHLHGHRLAAILLSVAYVKFIPIKTPEEYRYQFHKDTRQQYSAFRAMSPYIYMLILLPAVRYLVPMFIENGFALLCTFGYIVWVDVVIFICAILGALTLRVKKDELFEVFRMTARNVMPVLITMGSLLVLAYIMQESTTGMMSLIADDIAALAGTFYPAAAVLIGSLGSFITGTGLGSNIMFAGMHTEAAAALGMNPITVFAGQNAGASLGNLICPNNTVAACATVGEVGNENKVMRKTLKAFAVILVEYMVLAMLYTLVLFPNFGM